MAFHANSPSSELSRYPPALSPPVGRGGLSDSGAEITLRLSFSSICLRSTGTARPSKKRILTTANYQSVRGLYQATSHTQTGGRKLAYHCQDGGFRAVNASTTRDLDPEEPVEDTPPAPADSQSMKLPLVWSNVTNRELIDNLEREARSNCNRSSQQETECCLFGT